MTLRGIQAKSEETSVEDEVKIKKLVKIALLQSAIETIKAKTPGTRYVIARQMLTETDYWVEKVYNLAVISHQLDVNTDDKIIVEAVKETLELFAQD